MIIAKATDENLTSENWELILVCFPTQSIPYKCPNQRRMFAIKSQEMNQGTGISSHDQDGTDAYRRDFSARDATASLIKRLAHRNANVQLYTLEVGIWMLEHQSGGSL